QLFAVELGIWRAIAVCRSEEAECMNSVAPSTVDAFSETVRRSLFQLANTFNTQGNDPEY
ncbi:hypothetical protein, partial [Pseudomonas sp.]|uniref:hypothetical protein n=1 Tax=Pseudomonas sp. TaxID=306 RepID=UPI002620E96D